MAQMRFAAPIPQGLAAMFARLMWKSNTLDVEMLVSFDKQKNASMNRWQSMARLLSGGFNGYPIFELEKPIQENTNLRQPVW